jgi:hypothetical protein
MLLFIGEQPSKETFMDYIDKIEVHDLMKFFLDFPLVRTRERLN